MTNIQEEINLHLYKEESNLKNTNKTFIKFKEQSI